MAEPTPTPTPTPTPAPKAASLLDDTPAPTPEPKPGEPAPANAPSEEAVKKWTEGIKATDLGDGVQWDDEALKAMTPALMELSGNDPKKAEGLVKAYTAYKQAEINKIDEANNAYALALIEEDKKRFGADLQNVVAQAQAGGKHVFGEQIWNQLKTVPQFCNNPDILERLAAIGRTVKPDTGAVVPQDGKAPAARRDWREGMYGKGSK